MKNKKIKSQSYNYWDSPTRNQIENSIQLTTSHMKVIVSAYLYKSDEDINFEFDLTSSSNTSDFNFEGVSATTKNTSKFHNKVSKNSNYNLNSEATVEISSVKKTIANEIKKYFSNKLNIPDLIESKDYGLMYWKFKLSDIYESDLSQHTYRSNILIMPYMENFEIESHGYSGVRYGRKIKGKKIEKTLEKFRGKIKEVVVKNIIKEYENR